MSRTASLAGNACGLSLSSHARALVVKPSDTVDGILAVAKTEFASTAFSYSIAQIKKPVLLQVVVLSSYNSSEFKFPDCLKRLTLVKLFVLQRPAAVASATKSDPSSS